jgi:DNA (cytosine-5)-methyltransferase 1
VNELALFAGAGGGILGGKLLGWRTVCAVERDAYAAQVLAQRQNDGILEPFPIWSDVTTFDGKPWRGIVDVISGGFPCQDISIAGSGAGIEGERSGMWKEMARIVGEVRPLYVFVENSPMLVTRGLGTVLGDLASMGFDAEWGVLSAADVGANHVRERIWILANSYGINSRTPWAEGLQATSAIETSSTSKQSSSLADTESIHAQGQHSRSRKEEFGGSGWWSTEPALGRVADGVADRVDRLKAIGNGQVPLCASTAFSLLAERMIQS